MKKRRLYRYKNIFMYSSLQFCGHAEEYFAKHTEKLIVFIVMPRLKNKYNLFRLYRDGVLQEERKVWSSSNFFLYYASWYIWYLWSIVHFFNSKERFYVLSSHPISFIGMGWQLLFRKIKFVYTIGDYFPPVNFSLRAFEWLKKYYHGKIYYTFYLSDTINKIFNGSVITTRFKRTVMLGVRKDLPMIRFPNGIFRILFVGLIKESQGLPELFLFLRNHHSYCVTILGICERELYGRYMSLIRAWKLEKRVFFLNKFYPEDELRQIAQSCHVGVALYDRGNTTATHYTDPGKVKTYAELGLPIIMTNTSAIVPYIRKFHCGELINSNPNSLLEALVRVERGYINYRIGLQKFVDYFYYETYYHNAFKALEQNA